MEFNKLIPELYVANLEDSLKFYVGAVGFKVEYGRPENKFVFLSINGAQLMLQEIDGGFANPDSPWFTGSLERPFGRGMHFQVEVDDADKVADSLKRKGYDIREGPRDYWFRQDKRMVGMRGVLVMDPDGYMFLFNHALVCKPVK